MSVERFAKPIGYLRVVEKRLLNRENIERALDTSSADEALKLLSVGDYDFGGLKRPADYELALKAELKRVYAFMYDTCPEPDFIDILAIRYDYHNLKVALKAKYLNNAVDKSYIGAAKLDPDVIDAAVFGADTDANTLKPLWQAIKDAMLAAMTAFEESNDPQVIDIVLDKANLADMRERAEAYKNEYIIDYVRFLIDFYNLKSLLRAKKMNKSLRFMELIFAEGGSVKKDYFMSNSDKPFSAMSAAFVYKHFGDVAKRGIEEFERTSNFSFLEKLADNYLIEYMKKTKLISMGPEPLFTYVLAKEAEIKQVRILMIGKLNNMPLESLRERLRESYV